MERQDNHEEGIKVIIIEESYTSKASFSDNDYMPSYEINNKINMIIVLIPVKSDPTTIRYLLIPYISIDVLVRISTPL